MIRFSHVPLYPFRPLKSCYLKFRDDESQIVFSLYLAAIEITHYLLDSLVSTPISFELGCTKEYWEKFIALSVSFGILYGAMLGDIKFPFFDGETVLNILINCNLSTDHFKFVERMNFLKQYFRLLTVYVSVHNKV